MTAPPRGEPALSGAGRPGRWEATPAGATALTEWEGAAAAVAAFRRRYVALLGPENELAWVVFRHGTVAAYHFRDPRPEFGGFGPAEDRLTAEWFWGVAFPGDPPPLWPWPAELLPDELAGALEGAGVDNRCVWALQEEGGFGVRRAFAALLGPEGDPGPEGGPCRVTPLGGGLWLVHFPDPVYSPALFNLVVAEEGADPEAGVGPAELLPAAAAAARAAARLQRASDRALPEAAFAIDRGGALFRWAGGGFVPWAPGLPGRGLGP